MSSTASKTTGSTTNNRASDLTSRQTAIADAAVALIHERGGLAYFTAIRDAAREAVGRPMAGADIDAALAALVEDRKLELVRSVSRAGTSTRRYRLAEVKTVTAGSDEQPSADEFDRVRNRPISPRVAVAELAAALNAGESDAELKRRLYIYTLGTGAANEHDSKADIDAAKVAAVTMASQRGHVTVSELWDQLGYVDWSPYYALESLRLAGVLEKLEFVTDGKTTTRYLVNTTRQNGIAA